MIPRGTIAQGSAGREFAQGVLTDENAVLLDGDGEAVGVDLDGRALSRGVSATAGGEMKEWIGDTLAKLTPLRRAAKYLKSETEAVRSWRGR